MAVPHGELLGGLAQRQQAMGPGGQLSLWEAGCVGDESDSR